MSERIPLYLLAQVEEVAQLRSKSEAQSTQIQLLREDVKTNTRDRWYSNHRARWHNDPATTLQIDWSQLAGVTAKAAAELVNEHTAELSGTPSIDSLPDAFRLAQAVCDKLHTGMGVAAYVAYTGLLQDEQLNVAASAGCSVRIVGKPLPPVKCPLTYLAKSGGEMVHIPDVKAENQVRSPNAMPPPIALTLSLCLSMQARCWSAHCRLLYYYWAEQTIKVPAVRAPKTPLAGADGPMGTLIT